MDTLNKSAMDITPFRNILNEMYSADVSVKIKSARRARFNNGKYMGTIAPYGYLKDPNDHNHLIIDEAVAPVVKKMFELALEGNGIGKIRKYLNANHILRPAAYAMERGDSGFERFFENNEENRYIWSENSVRGILRSPVYAGHIVGYKRPAISMKSKKRPSKLPENWEYVRNTHEGIVTQADFDTVQRLMTSRRRGENAGFDNIFSGVIKCADCGYAMRAGSANRRKRPDIIDCVQYSCNNYGRYGNINCTSHTIEARDLMNVVLADINHYASMALNDERAFRTLQQKLSTIGANEVKVLEREKRKLTKRITELDKLFSALYEDKVMERITERNFEVMTAKYVSEQQEVESRLSVVEDALTVNNNKDNGVIEFLSNIRTYSGITELTATIVNSLIDRIEVSERKKDESGEVVQKVSIYYKFIGSLDNETFFAPTKRICHYEEKLCTQCGKAFQPKSNVSRNCPTCQEKLAKEARRSYDAARVRSKTHLDPRPCQCCGEIFKPGSHNARFCPTCFSDARKLAAKEWSKGYYQRKKAIR